MRRLQIKCDWCDGEISEMGFDFWMNNPRPEFNIDGEEICRWCYEEFWEYLRPIKAKLIKDAKGNKEKE